MSRLAILKVAGKLRELLDEIVFVGGCAGLLLMPATNSEFRPTDDVDFVVPVTTYLEFTEFEAKLRALGCSNSQERGDPVCRWLVDGITVDLMPVEPTVLGFGNRWYPEALRTPVRVDVGEGVIVQVVSLPVFLATKFEAHGDRGGGVYLGDSDIEDIVLLLAHRIDSYELVLQAPEDVRLFLKEEASKLLIVPDIKDIVSACFAQDEQTFAEDALKSLGQISNLTG